MSALETGRKLVEKATGWARPSKDELARMVRQVEPQAFRFEDDGLIPNHPEWPLIVYRGAVRFRQAFDPAAALEDLFHSNGWGQSWRNGVYDFAHYHSMIHEVLGVAKGSAEIRFGGERGRALAIEAGDVAILPAGTGHQRLSASSNFLVVGAYPPTGTYDLCRSKEDHDRSLKSIPKVPTPGDDPVYGSGGPLLAVWRS